MPAAHLFGSADVYRTKSDLAYAAIKTGVQTASFSSGRRLGIKELAEQLDMSPIPVREALKRLATEGLLTADAHRGFFVPCLSSHDLTDIYDTLEMLEPAAAELAFPRLSVADIDRSEQLVDEMIESESNPPRWVSQNLQFHMTLYRPAGRTRLLRAIEQLAGEAARELQRGDFFLDFLSRSDYEHRRIVQLLRDGEIHEMKHLLAHHIQQTREALVGQKRIEEAEGPRGAAQFPAGA